MKVKLTYTGPSVPWLYAPWLKYRNGVWVFGASSKNKRAHVFATSGSGILLEMDESEDVKVEGSELTSVVSIDFPELDPPLPHRPDGLDYPSPFLWEYRYGPVVVLAPVWEILRDDATEVAVETVVEVINGQSVS